MSKTLIDNFFAEDRVVITAELEPTTGNFIQPTGFPDIGACVYVGPDGRRHCLVESEQSMSNRLEAVCMEAGGGWRVPLAGKLPIIKVMDKDDNLVATNLTEPHRIASSYILEGTWKIKAANGDAKADQNSYKPDSLEKILGNKLGLADKKQKTWALDKRSDLTKWVFALDPAAILHGFQFMQWSAVGLRQQRLLHARLEADLAGDSDVHYGMVKTDWTGEKPSGDHNNRGQSIAAKERLVPESITATFEIDILGLREKSLAAENNDGAQKFLLGLALWKIRQFLADQPAFDARTGQSERALRLRSDCALKLKYKEQKPELSYQTQSGGADFGDAEDLTLDQLVGEKNALLVSPPKFGPLLQATVGKTDLNIAVTYKK